MFTARTPIVAVPGMWFRGVKVIGRPDPDAPVNIGGTHLAPAIANHLLGWQPISADTLDDASKKWTDPTYTRLIVSDDKVRAEALTCGSSMNVWEFTVDGAAGYAVVGTTLRIKCACITSPGQSYVQKLTMLSALSPPDEVAHVPTSDFN